MKCLMHLTHAVLVPEGIRALCKHYEVGYCSGGNVTYRQGMNHSKDCITSQKFA